MTKFTDKTIDKAVALKISQARAAKKWTQADLAKAISEKLPIVVDYERGTAIPSEAILAKMEKALGTKLRAKKK